MCQRRKKDKLSRSQTEKHAGDVRLCTAAEQV
jgi:hypothetical protein